MYCIKTKARLNSRCCSSRFSAIFISTSARRAGSDRKSTRLNSSHLGISYAVFCLNVPSTTDFYTLSLHDALPIFELIELREPEVEAGEVQVGGGVGISSQVADVLHQDEGAVEFALLQQ